MPTTMIDPTAGSELRRIRTTLGVPQGTLAGVLGITYETLSRMENGRLAVKPSLLLLARLLTAHALAQQGTGRPCPVPAVPAELLDALPPVTPLPPPSPDSRGLTLTPGSTCGWKSERCRPPWWHFAARLDAQHHLAGDACEHHLWILYRGIIRKLRTHAAQQPPPTRGRQKRGVRPRAGATGRHHARAK